MTYRNIFSAALIAVNLATPALADDGRAVGEVDTTWRTFGANDKIKVVAFEDPKVKGVTCFLSRAVTGGINPFAEDTSDASVACRQTGPVEYREAIDNGKNGEEVFSEKRSAFFKKLHVTRMFDKATNTLVYLTWSDKWVDGSPKNSISAVTPMPWGTQTPGEPKLDR